MKSVLKKTLPGFAVYWMVYTAHWYFVSEFSKLARFSLISSTTFAALFTLTGLLLGLGFKWRPLGLLWDRARWWTLLISILGISLLSLDYILWSHGIFSRWTQWMRLCGYILSGFPLLHLPEKGPNTDSGCE